jgi:hypothetical protein
MCCPSLCGERFHGPVPAMAERPSSPAGDACNPVRPRGTRRAAPGQVQRLFGVLVSHQPLTQRDARGPSAGRRHRVHRNTGATAQGWRVDLPGRRSRPA